ncbi:MAG: porin [Labrys sp. (in: a-proteobacteria)]
MAAEPVEYVASCTQTMNGGILIPGTDTCLRIGGEVRADYFFDDPQGNGDTTVFDTTALLKFDARTRTEYGTLRSYIELTVETGDGAEASKAFIQLGGLTAGYAGSAYRFFDASYSAPIFTSVYAANHTTNRLSYTQLLGEGVYATLSAEDAGRARTAISPVYFAPLFTAGYGGQEWPDLVAAIGVNQSWGRAQIMAAAHQVRYAPAVATIGGAVLETFEDEVGFAVGAGVGINLPFAYGGHVAAEVNYAEGAMRYLGILEQDAFVYDTTGAFTFIAETSSGWSVASELQVGLSHSMAATVFATYVDYNAPSFVVADYTSLIVGALVGYEIVPGFAAGVEIAYEHRISDVRPALVVQSEERDTITGGLRLKRVF